MKTPPPVTMPSKSREAKAHDLKFYLVEVLDKIQPGEDTLRDHGGMLYLIALHAPLIAEEARMDTQDAHERNSDPRYDYINNLTAYFIDAVKRKCRERGVTIPVRWSK